MDSVDYEMNYIQKNTGKLPAVRGLDFMGGDFDGVVKRSKDWWEKRRNRYDLLAHRCERRLI